MPHQLAETSGRPVSGHRPVATRDPRLSAGSDESLPVVGSARALAILRYLDVVLVVLATPVALLLGAPAVGVVVGASAWLVQHWVAVGAKRWIAARGPDARFGLNLVDGFGRIWLLAGAIVLAAVIGGRSDGLAAALMIFGAYSVAFAVRLVSARPQGAQR